MKERYQIWLDKMTKKELALIAKAEERAEVRKEKQKKDMKVICESIKKKGVTLRSLEGSEVTISQCVRSDFPPSYNHTPRGTVVTYKIEKGRPRICYVRRNYTYKYIVWNFTNMAKEAIIEASITC